MHIEILVEDVSGKRALEALLPKIATAGHTVKIHSYKGIGHLPKTLRNGADPQKRVLLNNLPRLLRGYGHTFSGYGTGYKAVVVLVCDLDDRNPSEFLAELNAVAESCDPRPEVHFCIAIEEGEAWLLGDPVAVKAAYPNAKDHILSSYENDSICGTWETLANAVYQGGAESLRKKGPKAVGTEKYKWAERIAPRIDVERNASPSFRRFRDRLRAL